MAMLEIAGLLAGGSVILLILSFTWATSLRRPLLARLDGRASATADNLQIAAFLLLTAVGVSSAATGLAFAYVAT